ncbi:2Fe-2S iron-sulfur cluster protein [Arcticibacter pallidicorallinus]|uniref:2Fe-2S iron-sulfur cluster protein n=1 Tax=Arcticibacter pallidicorallinus TaxID=1259464 RepID=A0A2T0UC81_9SPHI|nr:2Fe-2S iron-sulfur cluster-binding protein [Arcticibacter pallidicorallinus]PRY55545.1 2Fe-2S iron-sulfur cluster protein [Arcticibacter pallidicorallinus]
MSLRKTILFTLHYASEAYSIQVMPNEYYSLMTLIADKLAIPGFGLCCGMGSCGTCLVQIAHAQSKAKANVLACDIRVDDSLANAVIIIPDTRF